MVSSLLMTSSFFLLLPGMARGSLPSLPLLHAVIQTVSALLRELEDLTALGSSNHLQLPPPILNQQAQPALIMPEVELTLVTV